ncbi:MAG TPA: sugar ABC transporter substrate-binding protein [Rugosimonospora sp.]
MGEMEVSRRALLRVFGGGAVAAMGVAAAGCGSDSGQTVPANPDDVSGKVTMWIYPIDATHEKDWWPAQIEAFRKQYTKVDVTVTVQPWADRDTKLTTAIAGDTGPDVVYLIPDQLPQYAQSGSLADVSDVIASDKSDFRPNALDAMTYNDTLYGVPILMGGTGTLINKKVMAAAGITQTPASWDDMLAIAPALKAKGYYLTEYEADPAQTLNLTFYPLLWEAGGEVLSPDGKSAAFNSPAGVATLSYLKQLVDGGYVPTQPLTKTPPTESDPVAHGKVAVVTEFGVSDLFTMPGVNLADWEVVAPLKKTVAVGYGVVGGLSVLEGAQNKVAAKAWVKWLASPDQLKAFDKDRKYFSPRVSVGALFAGDPLTGAAEKFTDDTKSGEINPKARQVMDLIKPEIQATLLGHKSVTAALDSAAKSVNDLLARG